MPRPSPRDAIHLSRREALHAALLSALAATGCDRLTLPPSELLMALDDIVSNDDFYVQHCCGTPQIDPDTFSTELLHGADPLGTLDAATLMGLDGRDREHTLECIGARPRFLLIGNAIWTGLPFLEVLDALGIEVPDDTVELRFDCADGYFESLPVADLDDNGAEGTGPLWLVWGMNGEALPVVHGGPFRFLIPGRYGTKNPKWVTRLTFTDEEQVGYWEQSGWDDEARYKTNSLILSPPELAVVGAGTTVPLLGAAFSGKTPIERVEVTTDDGETWQDAQITYSSGEHVWTLWSWDWLLEEPGTFSARVRVTAADGTVSNPDPEGSGGKTGYDGGMEVTVRVS